MSMGLPPNSGSIISNAFPATSLTRNPGGDILTIQQRFDTTRRKLHQLAVVVKRERDPKEKQFLLDESRNMQLFSTLLYLTLMMHKIDEIKVLLKESDPSTYVENQAIFDSLRSPGFHLERHHQSLQKAKKIFERKQKYKMMHDETLSKLAEYEEKVGKLQDLATGTARDFSEAMKSLGGSSGDASVQAANQATMTVELKHMQEKLDAMEANLKKATGELEESRLGNLVAKEELAAKDIALARAHKDIELTKLVASGDANAKLGHEQEAKHRIEAQLQTLTAQLETTQAELKSKSDALAVKDKEYATLAYEYSKVNSVQGEVNQDSEAKLKEATGKVKQLEMELNENVEVLNHAQKRVIILESSLEDETKKREIAEEKCRNMKFEVTEMAERLAELNEKGVDVDMDRPISRGGLNRELDDGSSLSASISSYVRPKFKGEAEYTKEQQAERHKAVTKLQQMYRRKQSYNKWFQMKLELTSKAGVMMALSGTAQGHTGFYLNPSSSAVYYWVVKETGEWVDLFKEISMDQYRELELTLRRKVEKEGDGVLVPIPGTDTEQGGDGFYLNSKQKAAFYVNEGSALKIRD
ncbi:hypothetical protein TL16_g05267 [Triparma laevis f. inornata]|uniref:Uncharacterized protein n=1 Tax=Triparma laevis f. inornata TaxID=1714386 RepID=A0A9W7E8I6_9STRA|nr:hypothetical protein TL16_g05267 [Triparma laevis f. inornata]